MKYFFQKEREQECEFLIGETGADLDLVLIASKQQDIIRLGKVVTDGVLADSGEFVGYHGQRVCEFQKWYPSPVHPYRFSTDRDDDISREE